MISKLSGLLLQLFLEELVYHLRVRLALRGLHYLADEKAQYGRFPGLELGYIVGGVLHDLLDYFRELAFIRYLRKALCLHDIGGGLAWLVHLPQNFLGPLAAYLPALDHLYYVGQSIGAYGAVFDIPVVLVQEPEELAH